MKKLLMGSLVLTIFAFAITIFQLSCVKATVAQTKTITDTVYLTKTITDTALVCTPSINGLWIGTYSVNGNASAGQQYADLIIKPDGTLIYESLGANQEHLATGTWTLSGTLLTCTSTAVYGINSNIGVAQTFTFQFNKTNGTLTSGIWSNNSIVGSGTFSLTKAL